MTDKETERSIMLRDREITYTLQRKRVKNMNLRIHPDGRVTLSAPTRVSMRAIEEFLHAKTDFVLSALDRFHTMRQNAPNPIQYTDGDKLLLLGNQTILRLTQGTEEYIVWKQPYLEMTVRDTQNFDMKRKLMEQFQTQLCTKVFNELLQELCPLLRSYGVTIPRLRIRAMKTRWGSCTPHHHVITLNTRLIEAPRECIAYVVLHELCHFVYPNHSAQFHALVASFMPDWKARKKRLNNGDIILR